MVDEALVRRTRFEARNAELEQAAKEASDSKNREASETKEDDTKPKEATKQYVVKAGHRIAPYGAGAELDVEDAEARFYEGGEVISLTAALAKHYIKIGCLDPYVE